MKSQCKKCVICNTEFLSNYKWQLTCSESCSKKHALANAKRYYYKKKNISGSSSFSIPENQKTKVTNMCKNCNKPFEVLERLKNWAMFCSLDCKQLSSKEKAGKGTPVDWAGSIEDSYTQLARAKRSLGFIRGE